MDYSQFEEDGPKFLRLAARLPLYEGAVRKRIEIDMQKEEEKEGSKKFHQDYDDGEPRTMTMREALARSKGNDDDVLKALNEDASKSAFGALFEHTKVSTG